MFAPRELEQLAAFVDVQLAELRLLLEQEHKPIFPIWAESDTALSASGYNWSFGAGLAAASGLGVVFPFRSSLVGLSLSLTPGGSFDVGSFSTDAFDVEAFDFAGPVVAKVEVERDGIIESAYAVEVLTGESKAQIEFHTALEFHEGSVLNFRTFSETDTQVGNRVCAWMRKE